MYYEVRIDGKVQGQRQTLKAARRLFTKTVEIGKGNAVYLDLRTEDGAFKQKIEQHFREGCEYCDELKATA